MAQKYFDAQVGSPDLQLLPTWVRGDEELVGLTEVVTADIISRFTISTFRDPSFIFLSLDRWVQRPDGTSVLVGTELDGMVKLADGLYVALKGYAEDPAAADTRFRDALRREIAQVLRWRLPQHKRKGVGVQSESDGDTSKAYRDNADEPFPTTFPSYLRPFIIEEPSWSL